MGVGVGGGVVGVVSADNEAHPESAIIMPGNLLVDDNGDVRKEVCLQMYTLYIRVHVFLCIQSLVLYHTNM